MSGRDEVTDGRQLMQQDGFGASNAEIMWHLVGEVLRELVGPISDIPVRRPNGYRLAPRKGDSA